MTQQQSKAWKLRLAKRTCGAPSGAIRCGQLWRLCQTTASGRVRYGTMTCLEGHVVAGDRARLVR